MLYKDGYKGGIIKSPDWEDEWEYYSDGTCISMHVDPESGKKIW
jgi:hypothetical protein